MENAPQLRAGVHKAYSAVAEQPQAEHPFAVGREFAKKLGYPAYWLDQFPLSAESFTGVSNVPIFANLPEGATVLDLGCGAGLDALIAAQRVGPGGRVIGLDFSVAMLARAARTATEYAQYHIELRQADAEHLPLPDSSIDIALVNGIFNLNPDRDSIFHELARVTKPGGAVYAAELILQEPLPLEEANSLTNWFA